MSLREMLYRARYQVLIYGLSAVPVSAIDRFLNRAGVAEHGRFAMRKQAVFDALPWDASFDQATIDCLLEGAGSALGFPWRWRGDPTVWHRAPDTGEIWSQRMFWRIDYRPGNAVGDARLVWEPSRLQHLVKLALIALQNPDQKVRTRAGDVVEAQVRSWCAANPFPIGIHYASSMECALRLIAVCVSADLIRATPAFPRLVAYLARLVFSHAQLIERRLSLHSSAGNHTVAEGVGLVFAGLLFPELPGSARWLSRGKALLEQEAQRQVLPDGGGLEQAFWYHLFVVELIGLACWLLAHEGSGAPEVLDTAFQRGRGFLRSMADGPGDLASIGDSDNGRALSDRFSVVFDKPPTMRKEGLLTFETSGYSLVRRPKGWRLLFDHGPLGMAPNFGHGHADALSVTLDIAGQPIFCDAGTYMYGGDQDRRKYFRGTTAHNTVTVDSQDQAEQSSAFAWQNPYQAQLLYSGEEENVCLLLAQHNGYRRLGIHHLRAIYVSEDGLLSVWDRLTGLGRHRITAHWHVAVPIDEAGGNFHLETADGPKTISLVGGTVVPHAGTENGSLGWRSPSYAKLARITTLAVGFEGHLPATLGLVLAPSADAASHDLIADIRARIETLFKMAGK